MEVAGSNILPQHPYPTSNPIPAGLAFRITFKWIIIFPKELPPEYPYNVSRVDGKYKIHCALLLTDRPPPTSVRGQIGDVWVSDNTHKGVWINVGGDVWQEWGGNESEHWHGLFPNFGLWFNGKTWTWLLPDSLRGEKSRWRSGERGGAWMKSKGRYKEWVDPDTGDIKKITFLGNAVEAVDQWLSFQEMEKEKKNTPRVRMKRKRDPERSGLAEAASEEAKGGPQKKSRSQAVMSRPASPPRFLDDDTLFRMSTPLISDKSDGILEGASSSQLKIANGDINREIIMDHNAYTESDTEDVPLSRVAKTGGKSFNPSHVIETSSFHDHSLPDVHASAASSEPLSFFTRPERERSNGTTGRDGRTESSLDSCGDGAAETEDTECRTVNRTTYAISVQEAFPDDKAQRSNGTTGKDGPEDCSDGAAEIEGTERRAVNGSTSAISVQERSPIASALAARGGAESAGVLQTNGSDLLLEEMLAPSPIYPELPTQCCLGDREGKEWPKNTETIKWWNGLETILPFVRNKDKKEDRDVRAVKSMAAGFDALEETDSLPTPVVVVKLEEYRMEGVSGLTSIARWDEVTLKSKIEDALAAGKCVVVVPWIPDGPRMGMDESSIRSLRGSLNQQVQWTCARKRADTRDESDIEGDEYILPGVDQGNEKRRKGKRARRSTTATSKAKAKSTGTDPSIHRSTTLKEFLELLDQPDVCGNLLDAPEIEGEAPWFIRLISKDVLAWKATQLSGFSSGLKGHAASHSARRHPEERAFKIPIGRNDDGLGPQAVPFDCMRLRRWQLLSMAGFYSFLHHDANGLCTWATVRTGAKLWCIRELRTEELKGESPSELADLHKAAMEAGWIAKDCDKFTVAHNLFLCEGSVLIMPPGKWHDVYTPVKTLAQGGHFLTYKTMHLTQMSRWFDHDFGTQATNADHPGILRTLCRMALALGYLEEEITRRQFLSLAHMIMEPEAYIARTSSDGDYLAPFLLEEDEAERDEALRIIRAIGKTNGISREEICTKSMRGGAGWEDAGTENIIIPTLNEMKKMKLTPW